MIGNTVQRFVFVTLLIGVAFAVGNSARAAGLTIQVVNPTPNALHLFGTPLLFEAAITDGAVSGKYYRLSWDFVYTGGIGETYDQEQAPFLYNGSKTSIRYADNTTQFAELRYVPASNVYTTTPNTYRAKVDQCTDVGCGTVETTANVTGSFSLYDAVAFTGFAYAGASTGKCVDVGTGQADLSSSCALDKQCGSGKLCGGDAPGYAAFNCTLQQGATCDARYSVRYGVVPGGATGHGSLLDYSWFGQSDDAQSGRPTGWLTFNKNSCTAGDDEKIGLSCGSSAECGTGGVCTVLSGVESLPVDDPENWAGQPEMNRVYQAPETGVTPPRFPGQLAGWGRIASLAEYGESVLNQKDWGWLHLRGSEALKNICFDGSKPCANGSDCSTGSCVDADNAYTNLVTGGYQQCTDCAASIGGASPKCNVCSSVQLTGTKFCTVGKAETIGDTCNENNDCDNDGQDDGLCELPTQAYACNSCYTCDTTAGTCDLCEQCARYGVSFDSQRGQLLGYGWAGGEQAGEGGLGWIKFNPPGGVSILQGWLATRYGDIFSGGSISSKGIPPAGSYNATYVIQANGDIAFSSQLGATDTSYLRPFYPSTIPIPSAPKKYVNVLGRLNFPEIVGNVSATDPEKKHRYGTTKYITRLRDIDGATVDDATLKLPLNNTIYYYIGDLAIPDDGAYTNIEIQAGTTTDGVTTSGAGTLVVDGNVTLNGNVTYQSATLGDIVEVPSLGWLIRGDLTIDPGVERAVGAFLVLGCPGDGTVPCGGNVRNGTIRTGYSLDRPLVVNGLMMAKSFVFERNVISEAGAEGSEQIIYDGRFIANPPPGLQDLSAAVPSLRLDVPQ